VLVRQLRDSDSLAAAAAARLLASYGSREDAPPLVAWERQASQSSQRVPFSRSLVRRVSPTLRIHDLGRTSFEVSGMDLQTSAARRKAFAVPLYLVTRPKQTAPREQLMEALWPNLSPAAAISSLHQTLHFVRRNIAPWLGPDATPDYVPLNSELVYLDPDLVQIDSVAFVRQATEALGSTDVSRTGPSITRLYTGRFAPEFEYEDWAEDWRTLVHAQFLRLCHATAAALLASGRVQSAIDVLTRAVELDPLAFSIRASLVRALWQVGAVDAASDHYRQYANLMKRELGTRAPPLEALVADEP
jgi:DNA-binding SARP family transcriptional activator